MTDPILAAIREQLEHSKTEVARVTRVLNFYLSENGEVEVPEFRPRVDEIAPLSANEETLIINYIHDHPKVRAIDVAKATSTSSKSVRQFLRTDERFEEVTGYKVRNQRYRLKHDTPAIEGDEYPYAEPLKVDETKLDKEYTKVEKPVKPKRKSKRKLKGPPRKAERKPESLSVVKANLGVPVKQVKSGSNGTPSGMTATEYFAQTRLRVLNWLSTNVKDTETAFAVKQVAVGLNIGIHSATAHVNDLCDAEVLVNLGRARKDDLPENWTGQRPYLFRKFRSTDRKPVTIVPGSGIHMREIADGV